MFNSISLKREKVGVFTGWAFWQIPGRSALRWPWGGGGVWNVVWSEPHAEPRASAGKLWARRLVTELRDLLSFRGKRSAGPGLARRGGPCLCGRALGLCVSRSRAQSRVCAALGGVGVCGAQRFPCRSAPGLPGSRRTRQSYGRYQTCRGTSCLEKGSAVNPSGRAGACVTPGCLSQCEGLVGLRNSQQTELPVQQTTRWAWSTASPQFPALFSSFLL